MQASAWFQVSCPMCTAALQVELSAGFNDVQCSLVLECKHALTTAPAGADAEADHDEAPPAARVAGRERSGLRLGGRGRQFGGGRGR